MREFLQSRLRSFRYAFSGWWYMLRTQRNAWIHATFSLLVILVCLWLRLPPVEWAIILIAITIVWTAEFINTALEAIVDLASPQQNHLAKIGKDVGAAAVLIAAGASALIGLLIIGPPLLARLETILHSLH
jgi:diacylglycerol kinase (ATP)